MALFKIFKGAEADLAAVPAHEGYAYFCEDTGNMFIDTNNSIEGRIQLNAHAAQALKSATSGVPDISANDIFLKNMVASIGQGGTGGNTAAAARTNLDVAKKGKCTNVELTVSGWNGSGPYTQDVTLPGVSPANLVIPSPTPNSLEAASQARSYCSGQSTDRLTFTCKKKPSVALVYSVFVQEV